MMKRLQSEEGFSLVTALAVAATFLLLIQVLTTQVIHASQQTGKDRTRAQAFHIADAGIDRAMAALSTNTNFAGSTENVTAQGTVIGTFTTTVAAVAGVPNDRLITSTGTTNQTSPSTRRIQETVTLVPIGNFEFALFSASTTTFANHLVVNGSTFSQSDETLLDHSDIAGNIISPGNITTGNNSTITGLVWSGGNVIIANGTTVNGNVSATGSATIYGTVTGDVRAQNVTVTGGTVGGQVIAGVSVPKPVTRTLPTYSYNPALYSPAPTEYTSATLFNTFWNTNRNAFSGVYHVTDATGGNVTGPNQRTTLNGDLTIITNRQINISRDFASSSPDTRRVILISTYTGPGNAVTWTNQITMPPNVEVFIYTTGTVAFQNQKDFHGVVYAQAIVQDQNFTITYEPDVLTAVTGFSWDLSSAGAFEVRPGVWRECNKPGGAC